MATVREHFDTDARVLTANAAWTLQDGAGEAIASVTAKIAYDFEANAKFWYFYMPEVPDVQGCLTALLRSPDVAACRLKPDGDGVRVESGCSAYSEKASSDTLRFTQRVHLYLDCALSAPERSVLVAAAARDGFVLSIRDREYAATKAAIEKPLAFISHDSRDKDLFVRDLAYALVKRYCFVWYDEFSLQVGDSLRASIERGLREARKCIVVLSPHFLSNEGWGRAEFDSVFTREILDRENVILPVWLNVDARAVYEYSPRLADKVGLSSTLGTEEIARRLVRVIKGGP